MRIRLDHNKFWNPEPLEGEGIKEQLIEQGEKVLKMTKELSNKKFKEDYDLNLTASKMTYRSANARMPKPANIDGFKYLREYSNDEILFFVDTNNKELLVANRGSITDEDYKKTDVGVATGFLTSTKRYKRNLKQVEDVLSKYKGYTLLFTGHSLGASIANYLYEHFRKKGFKTELFVFNRFATLIDPYIKNSRIEPNKVHVTFEGDRIAEPFLKDKSTKHIVKNSPNPNNKHSLNLHK